MRTWKRQVEEESVNVGLRREYALDELNTSEHSPLQNKRQTLWKTIGKVQD